ncbi:MAG: hypothetical protein QG597_4224 [Actinomycetota bacterium]|nr:hypothetical protein [Actinomycetota bacterium]
MYLHRIGRTGRAGKSGVAVTLVDWDDTARWQMVNRALGLAFHEPVETYSTSEHVYAGLGIPKEATGRLPKSAQTRAGLDAEAVEDLGETGRHGAGSRGKGGQKRGEGRSGGSSRGGGSRSGGGSGSHRAAPKTHGQPHSSDGTGHSAAGKGHSAQPKSMDKDGATGSKGRRRRRTRGGRDTESN